MVWGNQRTEVRLLQNVLAQPPRMTTCTGLEVLVKNTKKLLLIRYLSLRGISSCMLPHTETHSRIVEYDWLAPVKLSLVVQYSIRNRQDYKNQWTQR
jgi:hypothetical protein